jgi:hypothetical protein
MGLTDNGAGIAAAPELEGFYGSLAELDAAVEADRAAWRETRRIGCAEYDPETNVINLHVYEGNRSYEVDLDRCETAAELADWLFHLAGKRWCKGSVLTDFIRTLERAIEERHGQDAREYFKGPTVCDFLT